ncbi:MAG: hypothetical protein ACO3UL_00160 [Flavobacteriaceae bacterium]|nr:hypothetical protein [Bacteroidota bacterium]MDA1288440.1 hypothetical protein [Bacteroidota bacterium]NDE28540.1 hypothetical protein [Flavobacteriia bacterium]
MKNILKQFRYLILLLPLGLFIALVDSEVLNGFLGTNELADHYRFLGVLILGVCVLLFVVLQIDKNSDSSN